jgi:hypothetical protein
MYYMAYLKDFARGELREHRLGAPAYESDRLFRTSPDRVQVELELGRPITRVLDRVLSQDSFVSGTARQGGNAYVLKIVYVFG